MEINVLARKDGIPTKIKVNGASSISTIFEYTPEGVAPKKCKLNLTLNGEYTRTPSKAFNMIYSPPPSSDVLELGYQVILTSQPPKAEFRVFKFHERSVITDDDLAKLNIDKQSFQRLIFDEPKILVALLEKELFSNLPESVARFLLQAKKCTSS